MSYIIMITLEVDHKESYLDVVYQHHLTTGLKLHPKITHYQSKATRFQTYKQAERYIEKIIRPEFFYRIIEV